MLLDADQMLIEEMWIAFGRVLTFKFIPIHEIYFAIGPNNAKALTCFHPLTGCNTVSSFSELHKIVNV